MLQSYNGTRYTYLGLSTYLLDNSSLKSL